VDSEGEGVWAVAVDVGESGLPTVVGADRGSSGAAR
jgi:hypothetical protein